MTHRALRQMIVLCGLLGSALFGSAGFAQQFSVSVQLGAVTPLSANARAQFEVNYDALDGLTLGGKLSLQNAPLGGSFLVRLNPNALYRFNIYGDGQLGVIGYGGLSLFGSYSPNPPTVSSPKDDDSNDANESNDDSNDDRRPGGTPTQTLGVEGLLMAGADFAYAADDLTTLYGGLEADLRLFPQFNPVFYPYLELDYAALDNLNLGVGGYVSWSPGAFGYNLYTNAFYDLTDQISLRFEIGFDGQVYAFLRATYKF